MTERVLLHVSVNDAGELQGAWGLSDHHQRYRLLASLMADAVMTEDREIAAQSDLILPPSGLIIPSGGH